MSPTRQRLINPKPYIRRWLQLPQNQCALRKTESHIERMKPIYSMRLPATCLALAFDRGGPTPRPHRIEDPFHNYPWREILGVYKLYSLTHE